MKQPTLFKTLLLLCAVDVALRSLGFGRVNRMLRSIKANGHDEAPTSAVLHQVLRATALYPGRSKCLEQSVVATWLLRRRGVDARVRLAVQHYPFAAHAWVEVDGHPVTESPEIVRRFVLLPEVA